MPIACSGASSARTRQADFQLADIGDAVAYKGLGACAQGKRTSFSRPSMP